MVMKPGPSKLQTRAIKRKARVKNLRHIDYKPVPSRIYIDVIIATFNKQIRTTLSREPTYGVSYRIQTLIDIIFKTTICDLRK